MSSVRSATLLALVCVACGADAPTKAPVVAAVQPLPVLASVTVTIAGGVEPLEYLAPGLSLSDTRGKAISPNGKTITWTSSDTSVALVGGFGVMGKRPGVATITASIDGVSGSATVHVAWRSDAWLVVGIPELAVETGDHMQFAPKARGSRPVPVADMTWAVSNPLVARMDVPGTLTTLTPGRTTVVAHYLGLTDSLTVNVVNEPVGFGYFYSGDAAVAETYDDNFWSAAVGKGFSTAGVTSADWISPYPGEPDLGWIGPNAPARDAVLHVVSLENVPCTAYLEAEEALQFVAPGAPRINCPDAASGNYQSVRVEFLAFRRSEFSGTIAVIRPGWPAISSTSGGVSETLRDSVSRTYALPGIAPDSLYWFASPGGALQVACSLVPTTVRVATTISCGVRSGTAPDAAFYAVAFGPDARHGTAPLGFAEIDNAGAVTRRMNAGLAITTTGAGPRSLDIVVSGSGMAAYNRLPAVLVTAISSGAAVCSITEPVRATSTTVTMHATCPAGVTGLMLGAIY